MVCSCIDIFGQPVLFESIKRQSTYELPQHLLTNVAPGLLTTSKLTPFFLQLSLELIELLITKCWRAFQIGLNSRQVFGLFAVEVDHGGSVPGQIFFEKVKLGVVEKLSVIEVV